MYVPCYFDFLPWFYMLSVQNGRGGCFAGLLCRSNGKKMCCLALLRTLILTVTCSKAIQAFVEGMVHVRVAMLTPPRVLELDDSVFWHAHVCTFQPDPVDSNGHSLPKL